MSALATLRAARETIVDPSRWTQGSFARDTFGNGVLFESRKAVRWCALGALGKHAAFASGFDAEVLLRTAADELFARQVTEVNDILGHPAVLRMYDRAIELADAEART